MAGSLFLTTVTAAYAKTPLFLLIVVILLGIALGFIFLLDMGILCASVKPTKLGWMGAYS